MTEIAHPADDTTTCRFCGETIKAIAKKCRFCDSILDEEWGRAREDEYAPSSADRLMMPVGRPASAIIAGYCGLFSVLPLVGIPFQLAAIGCGVAALKALKENSSLSGAGRAWFGIIFGSLGLIASLIGIVALVAER